jgi:hypothetical protein
MVVVLRQTNSQNRFLFRAIFVCFAPKQNPKIDFYFAPK